MGEGEGREIQRDTANERERKRKGERERERKERVKLSPVTVRSLRCVTNFSAVSFDEIKSLTSFQSEVNVLIKVKELRGFPTYFSTSKAAFDSMQLVLFSCVLYN